MAVNDLSNQNIQDTYQRVIQTDGTNTADGTGSLLPISFDGNNVIISGSLVAHSYVVSESITAVSSGSTIFGNSVDDIHQFTGSISISGSGTLGTNSGVPGLTITKDMVGDAIQLRLTDPTNNYNLNIGQGNNNAYVKFDDHANQNLQFVSDTSDSHIFLDGGTGRTGMGTAAISSQLTVAGDIYATHITASLNISASGELSANTVSDALAAAVVAQIDNDEIPIAKLAEDAVTVTAGTNLSGGGSVTLGGSTTLNVDDAFIKNDADDTTSGILTAAGLNSTTHITSSGNISASGFIHGNELRVDTGTSQNYSYFNNGGLFIKGPTADSDSNLGSLYIRNSSMGGTYTGAHGVYFDCDLGFNILMNSHTGQTTGSFVIWDASLGTGIPGVASSKIFEISHTGHITASGNISGSTTSTLSVGGQANVGSLVAAGTVQAEHLYSTDDAVIDDDLTVGGDIRSSGFISSSQFEGNTLFTTGSHTVSGYTAEGDIVKFSNTGTTAGDIYMLKNDGTWSQADADATTTATGSLAVAVGTNSTTHGMLLRGMVKLADDPNCTVGQPVFLGETAGHGACVAPTDSGDIARIVGFYMSGSGVIYFNPDNTSIKVS